MYYKEKNRIIENIAYLLDITPNMQNIAIVEVKKLEEFIKYKVPEAEIYIQGSFKLGTTIKPFSKDKTGDFDIDIVVQLPDLKQDVTAKNVKEIIGKYLKNSKYNEYLKTEGKRCWTLIYKKDISFSEKVTFHIDLLPSISEDQTTISKIKPDSLKKTAIAITKKNAGTNQFEYEWLTSNPKGYAIWFDSINHSKYRLLKDENRKRVYINNSHFFDSVERVTDEFIRTPLQYVIQILKRHRDVMYCNTESQKDKPISIIITTLVTKIVENNNYVINNTYELLKYVVEGLIYYSSLLDSNKNSDFSDDFKSRRIIIKNTRDGKPYWIIENPSNSCENLADKWNESDKKPKEFFRWVSRVKKDILDALEDTEENMKNSFKKCLGESFTENLFKNIFDKNDLSSRSVEITEKTPKPYKVMK